MKSPRGGHTMTLRAGSLFAGIGGFDLAAESVGMEVAWQSEVDEKASVVLDYHWPEVPNHGDIHNIRVEDSNSPTRTRPTTKRTGVSSQGRRRHLGHEATDLPNKGDHNGVATVDVLTGGFPCQDYSVAGKRGGLAGDSGALWWEYHRLISSIRPTWVLGENVPGLLSSRGGRDFETIVGSLTECGYGVAWAVLAAQYFGVAQRRRRVFIVGHSGGQPRPEVLALGEGMFGHPEPSREAGEFTAPKVGAFAQNQRDEVRELAAVGALASEPGMKQQTYVYPDTAIRRLTPLECERLQGFPDGWTDIPGNSDTQRYRQLGNAVAVPVVEWILKRIVIWEDTQ